RTLRWHGSIRGSGSTEGARQMSSESTSTMPPRSEPDDQAGEKYAAASRWRLVWRRFRSHKLAMVGLIVTILVYVVAVFGEMIAPYSNSHLNADYAYAPPQQLQMVDTSGDSWDWGLHVHGYTMERDPETLGLE